MTCLMDGLHVEGRGQTTVQRLATEVRRKLVRTQKTGLVAGPGRVCNNRSCDYLSSHVSRGEGSVCSSIVDKLNRLSSSTSVQGFSLKLASQPNVVPDDDEVCNGEIVKGRKKHKRRKIRDFGRIALDIHRPKFKRRGPMVRSAPNESRKRKGETWIWVIAKYDKSGKKSLIGETANGFKLFPCFGDRSNDENMQSVQQKPARSSNWFSSVFELIKGKRTGDAVRHVKGDADLNPQHSLAESETNQKRTKLPGCTSTQEQVSYPKGSPLVDENIVPIGSKKEAFLLEDVHVNIREDLDYSPRKSTVALTTENIVSSPPLTFLTGEEPDVNEKMKDPIELWTDEGATAKSDEGTKLPGCTSTQEQVSYPKERPLVDENTVPIGSKKEDLLLEDVQVNIREDLDYAPRKSTAAGIKLPGCTSTQEQVSYPKGSSLVDENSVPIELKKEALLLQDIQISIREDLDYAPRKITAGSPSYVMENIVPESMRNVLPHETEISICEQRSHETRRIHKWDVLKCIIYGGLIESIISLGVVSSAAGSDATTLNIAALGLANLISGFFVIVHNVRELKNDQNGGQTTNADDNVNRYQRVLGQRENFLLHIIVVMLSYLVFGSLPPVIYGFSFYKSNNKEYKLITVGVASLLCIFLLSIGKAHVQKPPRSYSKTIMYYVGIALTASGLSYVVGVLIKKLFAEVGWFDQSVTTSLHPLPVFLDTRVMIPQELISY